MLIDSFLKRLYERFPVVKPQRSGLHGQRVQVLLGLRLKEDSCN